MQNEQSQLAPMTDAEVAASIAGEVCAACGGPKRAGLPFCATDYNALPMPARWSLGKGEACPGFATTFRSWLRHLQLHPVRQRLLPARSGMLPYRTTDELEAAGYRFSGHAQCGAVRCLQPVVWYLTPDRRKVALDPKTLQPHRTVCRDPEWWERRKLKTSARRRRAS